MNKLLKQFIVLFSFTSYCFCDVSELPPWKSITPLNHEDLLNVQNRLQDLLPPAKRALVSIETNDGVGSGVIVSEDGLVLTAAHVIGKTVQKMNVRLLDGK